MLGPDARAAMEQQGRRTLALAAPGREDLAPGTGTVRLVNPIDASIATFDDAGHDTRPGGEADREARQARLRQTAGAQWADRGLSIADPRRSRRMGSAAGDLLRSNTRADGTTARMVPRGFRARDVGAPGMAIGSSRNTTAASSHSMSPGSRRRRSPAWASTWLWTPRIVGEGCSIRWPPRCTR